MVGGKEVNAYAKIKRCNKHSIAVINCKKREGRYEEKRIVRRRDKKQGRRKGE